MRLFSLSTLVRFETMDRVLGLIISLKNFRKPLDIFSLQIERKHSKEYSVIILAVKERFEQFSCLEFIFEKKQTPGSRLKTQTRIFKDTLILVFVNENCCLCMFHRIIFLLLIVSSLFCNFNRCAVCFQSLMNIACRSSQNAACIKRFWRLHIVIKPLNKEINIINFLSC